MPRPKIIHIPEKMEKFYGKGTMLHPDLSEIKELVSRIPAKKIITIGQITTHLSSIHQTDVTCPMRTGNALKKIANSYTLENLDKALPFWRVLRNDNTMIKSKNYEQWARLIEEEGFELSFTKSGHIKVSFDLEDVYSF